ncbi:ABC transporter permease [Anaerostipes hadrus]|jgi:lipopolysaccharide transport system permease protein|uniref:ABC transporter permease n=1 Tax=Anaerostipes hadrus TaxID=649756 RepID=UPI001570C809|nr:ABC transporter permease [Anaerostipes hadrus]
MKQQKFDTIIKSQQGLLDFNLKELVRYKDLIYLFVKRDFISKYKQTILGPLWAIIQPLFTTVVFTIIFGNLANLTTLDVATKEDIVVPGFLFYMAGTICWSYFSTTVTATANTFIANSAIMGKVYFPRMVTPIATSLSNFISFIIQFVMFVIIWFFYALGGKTDMRLSSYIILLPLLILQLILLSMAVGVIISSLTTKYRDLAMLVTFGLQLWQYATPVVYGLALIPKQIQWIYLLNPVTPIIITFRYAFFGRGYFSLFYYSIGWGITILLFFIGLILFNRIEKTFMDTV